MKDVKFGGTSVGTPQRMKDVAQLINDGQQKIVVLSAMSGTTNSLVEISDYYRKRNSEAAGSVINKLRTKYMQHLEELYTQEETKQKTRALLEEIFIFLHSFAGCEFSDANEKAILAQGELMSTNMVTNYLLEQGVKVLLLPALDYIESGPPETECLMQQRCRIGHIRYLVGLAADNTLDLFIDFLIFACFAHACYNDLRVMTVTSGFTPRRNGAVHPSPTFI